MAKKTWNEKLLDSKDMPYVTELTCKYAAMYGPRMLIAPPLFYDEVMKRVPHGKLITIDKISNYLAKQHNADWCCFMTAGIFSRIVAEASNERMGADETPYWRTLKKNGELNEKYPQGIEGHKMLLEAEGHIVVQKGKKWFVADYENKAYRP
ncbi:MAG: MGMT family protein [Firmicutes bacterium]|nr:MGMT family protein [Bacillota bacterium]